MPRIEKRKKQMVAIVSLAAAIAIIAIAFILGLPMDRFNDIMFVVLLVGIVPSAILDFIHESWKKKIHNRLPQLVRDLSESQETGGTLVKAFDDVAMVNYGPLTDEVKRLSSQMSWGSTFEKALVSFADRIGTVIARRFCILVIEAMKSGGRVRKVFTMLAESMERMLHLEEERAGQMRPYIIIIYAAFFVFIFTTLQLLTSFFMPLAEMPVSGFLVPLGSSQMFQDYFFHMMMIQSVLGGLVAGKIGEGRIVSGLKHSVIMLATGYTAFQIVLFSV